MFREGWSFARLGLFEGGGGAVELVVGGGRVALGGGCDSGRWEIFV
jgi:hypothetical protein